MKKIVEVSEQGLEGLLGERVLLFCMRYNYAGTLVGVNSTCVELHDAVIVFDTGDFSNKKWATAETPMSSVINVQISAIESFVKSDK